MPVSLAIFRPSPTAMDKARGKQTAAKGLLEINSKLGKEELVKRLKVEQERKKILLLTVSILQVHVCLYLSVNDFFSHSPFFTLIFNLTLHSVPSRFICPNALYIHRICFRHLQMYSLKWTRRVTHPPCPNMLLPSFSPAS